ncbi:hypothetical protein J6590_017032 [Homalodisca vitripennis]|nr:hypothetical protein J6590_017032 [Homalodisca vitripennis]
MEGRPRQSPACLVKTGLPPAIQPWPTLFHRGLAPSGRNERETKSKKKCASHRPPEQEEKGSGALARVPRGRHYPYGLESKTAPEGKVG